MKHLLLTAAFTLGAVVAPTAAYAQRAPGAVVVVVDTDRIARDCTACRAAATQMQSQEAALRTRGETLQKQLQSARKPIEDAVEALKGKDPDAALQGRIKAYQAQEQKAQQEFSIAQRNFQSTQVHVNQQVSAKLATVITSVAASRGANIALPKDTTLYSAPATDITTDVLAQLNAQLPAVSVTPLPQQAQPKQQPQGR